MAELGAAVVAFMSLASVIRPLYAAMSTLKEAPNEATFFCNQLGSLKSIVSELEHLRERVPADIFSQRLRNELNNVQAPLDQNIATLQGLLARAGAGTGQATSVQGRIWWYLKSSELKQLCKRLGQYRKVLTTLLVLLHSEYLPRHHDLLLRTYSSTTHLERMAVSIQEALNTRRHSATFDLTLLPFHNVQGSAEQIHSVTSCLQATLDHLSCQQKTSNDTINRHIAVMENMMARMTRNDTGQHLAYSPGRLKMRDRCITRFQYDFSLGTVVMSWGRLRRRRRRDVDAHGDSCDDKRPMGGFAATVEVVPALWLSQRAVIGGWCLTRDQPAAPSFFPRLSFPIVVPIDADVMRLAATDNVPGLCDLFSSRRGSVNDRTGAGWTPLHLAAAAGRIDSCQYLLAHGADVTSAGLVGVTPLHLAAAYGHLDVIKVLVDNEGDPEASNQHGFNTIFEVLHSPFITDPALKAAILVWILQQEHFVVDVNCQDYQGNSILAWFVQHYPGGVRLLLDHNADVNLRSHDGSTPLHKAAARGCCESVQLLLKSGADLSIIENDGSTPLVRAAEQGCFDIVQKLTAQPEKSPSDSGKSSSRPVYKPVQLLCEQGMPGPSDVVNQIIKTCSHTKATEQLRTSEIWHAAQHGYWSVVSKLQEAGVDPYRKNEYGYRALVRLAYKEDLHRVNLLIQSGSRSALIDDDLTLSLTRAAAAGYTDIVSHLLSLTTPAFLDNASGSKVLVAAAAHGHLAVVELLLRAVPEHCWYRALVRAAEHGHMAVVDLLLGRRVHPTRASLGGDTAIVRAARYGHLAVVQRLLAAGADPNQLGWFGYSALVRAAYNGHLAVVDCLLNAGALPDLPEGEGDCAMVRAVRQGHRGVMARLRRAGAQPMEDAAWNGKRDGPSKAR